MTDSDFTKLREVSEAIAKETYPGVSLGTVLAFLAVAEEEGRSVSDIVKLLNKPQTNVSRSLLDLSVKTRSKLESYDLLEPKVDGDDMRVKRYHLSQKGKRLMRRIHKIMERE